MHTRRWIAWFADAGHDVHLIDPFGTNLADGFPAGVTVDRVPLPARSLPVVGLLRRRRTLAAAIDRLGPDVLHAHFVRRYGWLAALSGIRPLVVTPWGSDLLKTRPSQLRTRAWNRYALRAAGLVTVSSEGMRWAAITAGARADRIRLVNHGVDTARFAPGPGDPELAERLAIGDAPVVFSARSLRPLYRQDTVIDALAALPDDPTPPMLVMSARGADMNHVAELRARAESRGVGSRLRILDDIAHDELADVYRLADVVISIPDSDSFPVTVLEAMACGRPVVASDLPAVTPVLGGLDPLARELIVPVGDAAATATALQRALTLAPDERERLARVLRRHVIDTADYDTNMTTMERLYRSLTARR